MANARRTETRLADYAGGVELTVAVGGRVVEVRRFPEPAASDDLERGEQLDAWRDWVDGESASLAAEHAARAEAAAAPTRPVTLERPA